MGAPPEQPRRLFGAAGSGPSGVLYVLVLVLVIVGGIYAVSRRGRAASRRRHADVAITGQGAWDAFLGTEDVDCIFPEVEIGTIKSVFLLNQGVPVRLELDSTEMRLTITSRVLPKARGTSWTAPWQEVVSATGDVAGFRTLDGKLSTVRLTDAHIIIVGDSAGPFLDFWDLSDEEDESATETTAQEQAEDAEWLRLVPDSVGPQWHPGSALLGLRMSAPDGLVEAIQRRACGRLPV